ncbi:MAG: protoporphyrinogen oxidase [Opitutales bacterium]
MGRILVIGGGPAGLVAGWTLRKQGHTLTVLEAGTRPGGSVQSIRSNGFLAETGPNTMQVTEPQTLEWIAEVGLESELVGTRPFAKKRFILRRGTLVPVPESPSQAIGSPLLSFSGKLRLAFEYLSPPRKGGTDESLADFARRRVGSEFLRYALDPMVGGIYAGDPEELSVRHAFPKVWALERDYGGLIKGAMAKRRQQKADEESGKPRFQAGSWSFQNGLETLTAHLATELGASLVLKSLLSELKWDGKHWIAKWEQRDMAMEGKFDALLLAAPAWALGLLPLPDPLPQILQPVFEVDYPPVASVVVGVPREAVQHALDGFGFLVPQAEGRRILGTLFSSSIFPMRAPKDHVTLTTYVGGKRRPSLAQLPREELRELVLGELRELLGLRSEPVFEQITTWSQAIPQYNVGYARVLEAVTQAKGAFPRLYFCGNYIGGISLEKTILTSLRTAAAIHEQSGSPVETDPELTSQPAEG